MATKLPARAFWRTAVAWLAAVALASGAGLAAEGGSWATAALATVGALACGALATWAFRVEAARAVGPAGSAERRQRRLSPAALRGRLAVGLAFGIVFALVLLAVPDTGDGSSVVAFVNRALFMAALYGPVLTWQEWATTRPGRDGGQSRSERGTVTER